MSPAGLVLGHAPPPDFSVMRLEFGTYVQVFADNDPTNTPCARSLGAIALDSMGNAQGDYNFLSLASGSKFSRHHWTALPMTDTAIARVEALAVANNQPLIQERGFIHLRVLIRASNIFMRGFAPSMSKVVCITIKKLMFSMSKIAHHSQIVQ